MFDIVLNWLDLLWIPLSFLIVRKKQRLKAIAFIMVCIISLRLQVELMDDIGFHNGFLHFISLPALYRGYWVYGIFIIALLGLLRFSRERDPYIYIAAAISVFIVAFCISTFIMVL
ncbi:MAG: hypothetical protein R3D88_04265 [Alphaproteobacteria bacterium]|nr:hypothetical protein [Alphaproteobacteria bacterium]